jgi:hypothetical protein
MPTLGRLAEQEGGWMWLTCPNMLCQHRVAAHLRLFANQLGNDCPMDRFRARLWCTMCGRLGGLTYAPSWQGSQEATTAFPEERGYYAHLQRLDAAGAFRHVVIDRRDGSIRRERLTAAQARAAAKRHAERHRADFTAMHFDRYRITIAQWRS